MTITFKANAMKVV